MKRFELRLGMFDEDDSQTFEASEFVEMSPGASYCSSDMVLTPFNP